MFAVSAKENDQLGVFSFKSLYEAYLQCRKGKRNTINALRFEADLLGNLMRLQRDLVTHRYRPSRSVCFYTNKPKLREIVAADFSDRVVHHCLVPKLEAIFEPKFIYDSHACRRHKGTHAAVARLAGFTRALQQNKAKQRYNGGCFLQLDIRSFFMSIDHAVLLSILAKQVHNPQLLWLATTIIQHNPVDNCHLKNQQGFASKIPPHKSLFCSAPGKGLPIGNLTSQFFANVYLNELDQFIKHQLKCRYYLRYVDDFILLHPSIEYLEQAKQQIKQYCATHLKLQFKADAHPQPCQNGIDFLGYITRPNYRLVRRRVVGNLKSQLHQFEQRHCAHGKINQRSYQCLHLPPEAVFQLQQMLASYLGHFKVASTKRLCRSLLQRYDFLTVIFLLDLERLALEPRLYNKQVNKRANKSIKFREQVDGLKAKHRSHIMLVQVGRFCELYDQCAIVAAKQLKLKRRPSTRGFRWQVGFPLSRLKNYKRLLRQQGINYAVVAEQGSLSSKLKHRQITEHLTFT